MKPARANRLLVWALRQTLTSSLVLIGASLLLFVVVRAAPGDAFSAAAFLTPMPSSTEAASPPPGDEAPWFVQYGHWLAGVLRGDFGRSASIQRGRPVAELVIPAADRSLALAAVGLALSALAAAVLAVFRTLRPHSRMGVLISSGATVLSNVPVFLCVYGAVVGGNALLAWGAHEGFWPLPEWFPFPSKSAWIPWLGAAGILAFGDGLFVDLYHRFQDELRRASRGDFLLGVRLLGLSAPRAVARGFLPGAASHVSRRIGFVLGSMVVLESAVGWPGLGYLAWRSASERDMPVLLAVALVLAVTVRLAAMASEVVWYTADPRKRTAG